MGPAGQQSRDDLFAPGDEVAGRFRIVREIGHGGMGTVYEAMDLKLARRVALKCARRGHGNRLPPEARNAREVSHFNVCKVHELHTATGPFGEVDFISMEFIEGETLSQRIQSGGPLPQVEARSIALQICAGLAQAHRQGVIHGDLKCGNIILTKSMDGSLRAVITDFGLAKPIVRGTAEAGGGEGTLDYMAPELLLGRRATVASDLYALGVVFHVMLAGKTPRVVTAPAVESVAEVPSQEDTATVGRTDEDIIDAEWQREIAALPSRWKAIVSKCLAPRPSDRFRSAADVAHALEARSPIMRWSITAGAACVLALVTWPRPGDSSTAPARLAVLPITVEGAAVPGTAGIGSDVADRLSRLRGKLTVIPPGEVLRNGVDDPAKARAVLGATHVLRTRLHRSGTQVTAIASVDDVTSGQSLRDLQGTYAVSDGALIARALIATVTGAFHLHSGVPQESVSPSAYEHYVEGLAMIRGDNPGAAIPCFKKAIQLDGRSALPWAGLAQAQIDNFRNGHGREWLDGAAESVARARSLNPDSVPVLLVSASLEQEHGWYEQAIRDYSRATELDPNDSLAWKGLATAYEATNRPADAVATYRRAIAAQPGYYRHYKDFGNFYFFRSDYPKAEELYRHVTEVAPGYAVGHMNLGLALLEQGRFPEAERALLTSVRLKRTPDSLLNLGALYYEMERYQDAAGMFEQSVAAGPPSVMIYRNLGDAYRQLGRATAAKAAYDTARGMAEAEVTDNPRRASSRVLLALVSAQLGETRNAEFELAQALDLEPENAMVMREAVITNEVLRKREKSLEIVRRAPLYILQELNRQPDVTGLRRDARFQDLLRNKQSSQ